jgi:hypothetical protein
MFKLSQNGLLYDYTEMYLYKKQILLAVLGSDDKWIFSDFCMVGAFSTLFEKAM